MPDDPNTISRTLYQLVREHYNATPERKKEIEAEREMRFPFVEGWPQYPNMVYAEVAGNQWGWALPASGMRQVNDRGFIIGGGGGSIRTGVAPTSQATSLANLLLQAVATPGEKTDEGRLIEAVTIPWFEIIRFLRKDPDEAFRIPPRTWEEIIAGAYKKAGYDEVTLTPRSRDFGRDVIAVKHGICTVRIIDQVKAYKRDHLVTADDVRALLGVLQGDMASKGCLTTTSDFAPRLVDDILLKHFIPRHLELVNGVELLKRLERIAHVG